MSASETVVMLALTLALAFAGWNCVTRTDYLVKAHRSQFGKPNGVRFYPLARFVNRTWYPAFLRGCGIAIWLCGVVFVYFTWFREPSH